jgi:hypothetical protein
MGRGVFVVLRGTSSGEEEAARDNPFDPPIPVTRNASNPHLIIPVDGADQDSAAVGEDGQGSPVADEEEGFVAGVEEQVRPFYPWTVDVKMVNFPCPSIV